MAKNNQREATFDLKISKNKQKNKVSKNYQENMKNFEVPADIKLLFSKRQHFHKYIQRKISWNS